ncbi:MAG: histidine kinase [Bacillota bacterium]|nr:histidine kinase [Bacillota bacterium]
MADKVLIIKVLLLMYSIGEYTALDMGKGELVVISILLYITSEILFYVLSNEKIKIALKVFSLVTTLLVSFNFNFFSVLVPLCLCELFNFYSKNKLLFFISLAAPIYFSNVQNAFRHIIISAIGLFFYYTYVYQHNKILLLIKENDDLREKNYRLNTILDKTEQYEAQIKYTSVLEERNRISQEIHDKIGHTISASLMQLEAAKLLLSKDADRAFAMVQNVIDVLRNGSEGIRSTLRNIKPKSEQMGFNKLKLMVEEFQAKNSISTQLLYSGDLEKIAYFQWKIILDNVGEALTNCVKHSDASTVKVKIEVLNKIVKAEVKDDGNGNLNIIKSLGLLGMEERTENAGGKLLIHGESGFSIITLLNICDA